MNFYICVFLIFTILYGYRSEKNSDLVISEELVAPEPLSIGLIFLIKINNTSGTNDYDVEITPYKCCLNQDGDVDCDSVNILSGCTDSVSKGIFKRFFYTCFIWQGLDTN